LFDQAIDLRLSHDGQMAARDLMNHDTVAGHTTPTERHIVSILRGSTFRAKQQQFSWIGPRNVILANSGKYHDIAAHEFRHRQFHEPTDPSAYFPKSGVQPARNEHLRIRSGIIEPALY
jgi:hypothetical protein